MNAETNDLELTFADRLKTLSWEKILIWGVFLVVLYLFRELFFIIFMTFVFCYIIRSLVGAIRICMKKESSPRLDKLITVGVFLGSLFAVGLAGYFIAPKVTEEVKALSARLQNAKVEDIENATLSATAGNYFFGKKYGTPADDRYKKALAQWKDSGRQGEGAYKTFPSLLTRLRAEFEAQYHRSHIQHLHDDFNDGDETKSFDAWFLSAKAPELLTSKHEYYAALWASTHPNGKPIASKTHSELAQLALTDLKNKPVKLAELREEWEQFVVTRKWIAFRASSEYAADFKKYYDKRRSENLAAAPFEYELFAKLKEAFVESKKEFLKVVSNHQDGTTESPEHLIHDFEAGMKQELAHDWWATSSAASSIREHVKADGPKLLEKIGGWVSDALEGLAGMPVKIVTALILTVLIVLDFHELKEGIHGIRSTRLRPIYDEIVPGVVTLGKLLGKSFRGQALIALFNAALTFVALLLIGVENKFMLSTMVFFFSFIPVLGVVLSGIPMIATAITQPGGSVFMALMVVLAVVVLHIIEGTVLGPKIVGKLGHMHPVLVMVILTIAEHFFGMWGLLLGVPVAIYIIRIVLLGDGIPGITDDCDSPAQPHAA